jgi:DNA-binding IclR family transcriptional regulator
MRVRKESLVSTAVSPDLRGSVDSLQRGLEILRLFTPHTHTLSVAEIAEKLDLPAPTTSRLVATLVAQGFLTPVPHTSLFRPDTACHVLSSAVIWQEPVVRAVGDLLAELARATSSTVCLAVRERLSMLCVEEVAHEVAANVALRGACVPIAVCAAGRAALWAQPSATQSEIIQQLRAQYASRKTTLPMPDVYRAFQALEEHGYCTDIAETVAGHWTVAAPLRGAGSSDWTVSCSIAREIDMTKQRLREVGKHLLDTVSGILAAYPRQMDA